MESNESSYKICCVGPAKSGKTYFSKRVRVGCGKMEIEQYVTTLGVEVHPNMIGDVTIHMWDIGSTFVGIGIHYTKNCDGILQFHNQDNDDPPFEIPDYVYVPTVHVYPEYWNNDDPDNTPLQTLIDKIKVCKGVE
uniref:Ras family GTPase n=1 Tax=Pithovirus LCPAC404 TaxID=2506597 RepID=A0A481ZFI2_9VIRU|nr:MAG: Ras family GTPase [Pithovirus LCPAC404]